MSLQQSNRILKLDLAIARSVCRISHAWPDAEEAEQADPASSQQVANSTGSPAASVHEGLEATAPQHNNQDLPVLGNTKAAEMAVSDSPSTEPRQTTAIRDSLSADVARGESGISQGPRALQPQEAAAQSSGELIGTAMFTCDFSSAWLSVCNPLRLCRTGFKDYDWKSCAAHTIHCSITPVCTHLSRHSEAACCVAGKCHSTTLWTCVLLSGIHSLLTAAPWVSTFDINNFPISANDCTPDR